MVKVTFGPLCGGREHAVYPQEAIFGFAVEPFWVGCGDTWWLVR